AHPLSVARLTPPGPPPRPSPAPPSPGAPPSELAPLLPWLLPLLPEVLGVPLVAPPSPAIDGPDPELLEVEPQPPTMRTPKKAKAIGFRIVIARASIALPLSKSRVLFLRPRCL